MSIHPSSMPFAVRRESGEKPRILLTGSGGQVGGDLLPLLQSLGNVHAPGRTELDLSDHSAIRAYVRDVKPRWIINPAAYTAVDQAESEPALAKAINTDAVEILGEEAARLGAAVIHFSTDYVFDGGGELPWKESDPTGPLSVYGATKLAGEQALSSSGATHLIFRTSWVFGTRGKNFLLTMLRLGKDKSELRIVADQYGAPTSSRDLALLTTAVIESAEAALRITGTEVTQYIEERQGVYHASSSGETTWFGFAEEILRLAAIADPSSQWARVSPITRAEYPTLAQRPRNSRLNCSRLRQVFGKTLPGWRESTAQIVYELLQRDIHLSS